VAIIIIDMGLARYSKQSGRISDVKNLQKNWVSVNLEGN
jgi:hypothetical protein